MPVWHACFMLVVAMAARVGEDHENEDGAPPSPGRVLSPCEQGAFDKASASPWLQAGEVHIGEDTYNVHWTGTLSEECSGKSGVLSTLSFTLKNATNGKDATVFRTVLKVNAEWRDKNGDVLRSPEVELTNWAMTNGLSVGLVQGARREPGQTYLMTEFLEGGQDLLHAAASLEWNKVVHNLVVAQLIYILVQLERQKIIHRDIKPENLVLVPFRKCARVKTKEEWLYNGCKIVLIDYGQSCTYDKQALMKYRRNLVCRDWYCGSPYEFPREILRTHWPSTRSDVFSMGVTIFYILTGGLFPQYVWMMGPATFDSILRVTCNHDLSEALTGAYQQYFIDSPVKSLLASMLAPEPGARKSPTELWVMLENADKEAAKTSADLALNMRKGLPQFTLPLYFSEAGQPKLKEVKNAGGQQGAAKEAVQPKLKEVKNAGGQQGAAKADHRAAMAIPEGEHADENPCKAAGIPEEWCSAVDDFIHKNEQLLNPSPECARQAEASDKKKRDPSQGCIPTLSLEDVLAFARAWYPRTG